MDRFKIWLPLAVFLLTSLMFVRFIFVHPAYWPTPGYHDSDEILATIALQRQGIVDYKQFPFWTPAIGGGRESFSYWVSMVLSPFFIFILLFGEIMGLKIIILLQLLLGLWGMYLLAKYFGCGKISAYLPPFIFLFSSIYPLQTAEGVYYNLSIVWIPWVFLYYLKGLNKINYLYLSALFCLLILLNGAIYPLLFLVFLFLLGYACFETIKNKNLRPLKNALLVCVLVFLLGAVKLLPLVNFSPKHVFLSPSIQYNSFYVIFNGLFSRQQLLSIPRDELWGLPLDVSFWEYHGAYIGFIPLIIFLFSVGYIYKKNPALILTGICFLLLSIANIILPIDILKYIYKFSFLLPLVSSSRFIWLFVFSLSLVVGLGLGRIEERAFAENKRILKRIVYGIVIFILADLILVNSPIFKEAFKRPPGNISRKTCFVQIKEDNVFKESKIYPTILENRGLCIDILELFEEEAYLCNAVCLGANRYRGEVFLQNGDSGGLETIYFSPNIVKVQVLSKGSDLLVLNQNYDANWKVRGLSENKVICTKGLVSVKVTPDDTGIITFYYFPYSFFIGSVISLFTLLTSILFYMKLMPLRAFNFSILGSVIIFSLSIILDLRGPVNKIPSWHSAYQQAVKGVKYFKNQNFLEALPLLKNASEYFPNSLVLHNMLKQIYEKNGWKEQALLEQKEIGELLPVNQAGEWNDGTRVENIR